MSGGIALLRRIARATLGLGDYEAYVSHRTRQHPGEPMLSRADFFRNRQQARYGGKNGGRCC
jgi:uncharacterized short protein YbdD (DUF466 family)